MELSVVTAIVRREKLGAVEAALQELGVRGISVSKVKGYGDYHNFFAVDQMVDNVRIEIFTRTDKSDAITASIMNAAHTGLRGDGVVVVHPIDKFFNIRLRSEAVPDNG